ncbi:MAG: choice-of-anchor F family protein [Thermoguttaceae bacterium]
MTGKIFAVALGLAVLSRTANAGLISAVTMFGTEAGTGPGLGTVSVPVYSTLSPDNGNQTGNGGPTDNNMIVPVKRFDHPDYIDIVFQVTPSGGVTEYKVFEAVDNNTLTNWSGYSMELGFDSGVNFTPSPSGDGLGFGAPNYVPPLVSSAFSTINKSEDLLTFTNGTQDTGMQTYQFRIDVPNLSIDHPSFTLREIPIPEPSSCLLLLCALTCMWIYRKHSS